MRYDETFPAVPVGVGAIRRAVSAFARECGLDQGQVRGVALAVSEAATNAVVHGYRGRPGQIHVTARATRGELTVVIADDGSGLVPRQDSPGLGLGLPIIASVASRFEVVARERGTEIRMVFPAAGSDAA